MLFVYGTLLSGLGFPMHDELAKRARLFGTGVISGQLVAISWYPGLIDEPGEVTGELYEAEDEAALLDFLDRYEGCHPDDPEPHEYLRRRCRVRLEVDGATRDAWVYEFIGNSSGLERIGGDFRNWMQGRSRSTDSLTRN